MSVWSDWRCWAITDAEYNSYFRFLERDDEDREIEFDEEETDEEDDCID